MKRKPMSNNSSKRLFRATAEKSNSKNDRPPPMRGGYRL